MIRADLCENKYSSQKSKLAMTYCCIPCTAHNCNTLCTQNSYFILEFIFQLRYKKFLRKSLFANCQTGIQKSKHQKYHKILKVMLLTNYDRNLLCIFTEHAMSNWEVRGNDSRTRYWETFAFESCYITFSLIEIYLSTTYFRKTIINLPENSEILYEQHLYIWPLASRWFDQGED